MTQPAARFATTAEEDATLGKSLEYRADIDGLRGIAVMAVVLFHCHLGLTGGYVGVDVFFVISGFLITRLIRASQAEDNFSLREFWMRRVRRLAPAVLLMVMFTVVVGGWLMFPRDFYYFTKSSLAQVLLVSNVHFTNYLDYFAGPSDLQPLLHTWSLAVEEQFYFVFPLLLVLGRHWSQRRLGIVLALLAIISLGYSVMLVRTAPERAFFLLPSRMWEMLLGGVIACLPPARKPADAASSIGRSLLWESVAAVSLLGIGVCFVQFSHATLFPGESALAPCLCTAALIYANSRQQTFTARLLAADWLVGVGLISYSLYLWHWPILSFLHYVYGEGLPPAVTVLALASSAACGYLSWHFVETPFRQRRVLPTDGGLVRGVLTCSLLVVAVSIVSLSTRGIPSRWGDRIANALASSGNTMKRFRTGKAALADQNQLPIIGNGQSPAQVLIWGDSHAAAIGQVCHELAQEHGVTGYVASRGGTVPLLGTWREKSREKVVPWNNAVLEFVRRNQIEHVILVSRWQANISVRENGMTDALIADLHSPEISPIESQRAMLRGLNRTVAALTEAGAHVWVMRQVPHQDRDPFRLLIRAEHAAAQDQVLDPSDPVARADWVTGVTASEHHRRQQRVDAVFRQIKNVRFLDPAQHCFDVNGRSLVGNQKCCFYSDPSHLSTEGSRQLVKPLLAPIFQQIAEENSWVASERHSIQR